jgi:hypothetical protein
MNLEDDHTTFEFCNSSIIQSFNIILHFIFNHFKAKLNLSLILYLGYINNTQNTLSDVKV